jgi:hypothetical protein
MEPIRPLDRLGIERGLLLGSCHGSGRRC